jgi:hypothetical protein
MARKAAKKRKGPSLADDIRPRKKRKGVKALDPAADFGEPVKKQRRQGRLKGMEDNAIQDLEDAAIEHSELRTEATASRVDFRDRLKASSEKLAKLMRDNGKKTYNHAGIRLKLREGQDTVSVQVKRHDKQDAA